MANERIELFVYDDRGGFRSDGDYLYRVEAQPEPLEAGEFIVGYSDNSMEHAAQNCREACIRIGLADTEEDFAELEGDLEEEE